MRESVAELSPRRPGEVEVGSTAAVRLIRIAVVVPCYNEETQIGIVIETMPDFIDKIVVVDDKSRDRTSEGSPGYTASSRSTAACPPMTAYS